MVESSAMLPAVQQMAVGVWSAWASDHRGTRVWPADWHDCDMSSAAQSPTLRAEAITAPSEVQWKGNRSVFTALLREHQPSQGLSFSSLWVGGCRLRFVTQWTWRRRSGMWWSVSLYPDKGGRHGAKGPCGHTFLNSSSAAYSHDQNIRSSHANTAVKTSRFHSHI